ncbi:MAG TPA: hypothetical protein PLO78_00645 [Candidatus Omnitrophota bacterium]|nr:hypothetical protein [Candidatus Omnitrophota bacterium]
MKKIILIAIAFSWLSLPLFAEEIQTQDDQTQETKTQDEVPAPVAGMTGKQCPLTAG